jgi:hypothetical protein
MSTRDELSRQAIRLANELKRVRHEAMMAPAAKYAQFHSRALAIRKQMRAILDQHARTPL